tara:strand:+ start:49 stop:390 length:342 start_codon:yes stop_codon:yes gene_type:complete
MTQETDQSLINKSQRLRKKIASMKKQGAGDNSDLPKLQSELRAINLELKLRFEERDPLATGDAEPSPARFSDRKFKKGGKVKKYMGGGKVYASHNKRYAHGGKVSGRKATYKY